LDELVHVDQNCVPQEPQILSALKLLSRDFAGFLGSPHGRNWKNLPELGESPHVLICSDELQLLHQVKKIFHTYFTPDKRV